MGTRPFPYPGSKAIIADWIVDHMRDHMRYVEVFGGAAAVLFTKERSDVEVYNDWDGALTNFFTVLRDSPDELQEWLRACPFSRKQHEQWSEAWYDKGERPVDRVERAGQFFFLRFTQWNGKHGEKVEIQHRGGRKAAEYQRAIDRIPEFSQRMQSVMVETLDYRDLISQYDNGDTLFYFDPAFSDWTPDDLYEEQFVVPQGELIDAIGSIDSYWQVSVLGENVPSAWVDDPDIYIVSKEYRNYEENLAMNYDPRNVPRFAGAASEGQDALNW